jgi:hypothetical protein
MHMQKIRNSVYVRAAAAAGSLTTIILVAGAGRKF